MQYGEMIDTVRRAGGIDADPGQVGGWLNERHQTMCVRANWSKALAVIGETVIGESRYALPETLTEIHELRVGSSPFKRTGTQSLWDLQGNRVYASGSGGFYSPIFSVSGDPQLELYPAPSEEGLTIEALATVRPAVMNEAHQSPVVPVDFHRPIVEGAMADALALLDENLAAADRYEARYDIAVEELRRRQNRRFGGGPHFAQIEGVHFRR